MPPVPPAVPSAARAAASPYLVRDERLSAMALALRGLPEAQLRDRLARIDCYARAGVVPVPGLEERDDADATERARIHRRLFPGDPTALPQLIDARAAFVASGVITPARFALFAAQAGLSSARPVS